MNEILFASLLALFAQNPRPIAQSGIEFREILLFPDSIYSPESGIDFEGKVDKWRHTLSLEPLADLKTRWLGSHSDESESKPLIFGYPSTPDDWTAIDPVGRSWKITRSAHPEPRHAGVECYALTREVDTLCQFAALAGWTFTPAFELYVRGDEWYFWAATLSRCELVDDKRICVTKYRLVVNGVDQCVENKVDQIIEPMFAGSMLFYLFEQKGKWGWYFDGESHPRLWEKIYHQYGDFEKGFIEPDGYHYFVALRAGMWWLVVPK